MAHKLSWETWTNHVVNIVEVKEQIPACFMASEAEWRSFYEQGMSPKRAYNEVVKLAEEE